MQPGAIAHNPPRGHADLKPFTVICPFLIALHFPRWPIFHNICSLLSELEVLLFLPLSPPSLLFLLSSSLNASYLPLLLPRSYLQLQQIQLLLLLPLFVHFDFTFTPSVISFSLHPPALPLLPSLSHSFRRKPLILYTHFLPVLRLPHCCSSIIPPPSNLVLLSSSSSSFISLHHIPAFHILPLSSPPLPLLPSSLLCF